jgi:hypothetical protein
MLAQMFKGVVQQQQQLERGQRAVTNLCCFEIFAAAGTAGVDGAVQA